jgi:hypothetical protein
MGDRDRIYIMKDDRDAYKKIASRSAFRKASNSEIFMLSLALGLRGGEPKEFGGKSRDGLVVLSSFPRKYDAIVKAIAISKEGVEVLGDPERTYTIAEEYANAGVEMLMELSSKQSEAILSELESIMITELKEEPVKH